MTPPLVKVCPTPKSEEWKFIPKGIFTDFSFNKPKSLSLKDFKGCKIAVGPTTQQFEAVSLGELEEEGYVSIKETSLKKNTSEHTKRAVLDDTTFELFKDSSTFEIEFLKSPPSNIWISTQSLRLANISLKNNVSLNACIFETTHETQSAEGFFMNFKLDEGCHLELGLCLNASNPSLSQINIQTAENSEVDFFSFLSGNVTYKRLEVNFFNQGKSSKTSAQGLCFAKKNSILDFHSNIFHLNKDQETKQIYKSICTDKSKSIFRGRVHLTEASAGANVDQLNNSLLLEKTASVDSQPELNIYQCDVKATHGATTSSIDDEHLFYFSSRGFKPEQSKKLLIKAFCKSSFSNLKNPGMKAYFSKALDKELQQEPANAH